MVDFKSTSIISPATAWHLTASIKMDRVTVNRTLDISLLHGKRFIDSGSVSESRV